MIAFFVGTTAELIKIAPVYHAVAARGRAPELWFTAWHVDGVAETLADLRLPQPDVWLVPPGGAEQVDRSSRVPRWAARVAATACRRRGELRRRLAADGRPPLVVVHGDTFSTPYGCLIARKLLGVRVAHIEAGMRSGSITSPFPEELNRRVASRLTDIHFAPTRREVDNLAGSGGVVVETGANTVVDAVRAALATGGALVDLPPEYGLATLHRFELLSRADRFREVLERLREAAERTPIVYFAGLLERERVDSAGLRGLFDDEHLLMRPKLRYAQFLPVLARARFVVTDSGGLQEECAYLGVPAAIHRKRTERRQGLGDNVVLTGMDPDRLASFLTDPESLRRPSRLDDHHPTEKVVATLAALDFC
ncbi:UDP-N-acetylglucosamine 2-epimerase [Saccharothrix variisporea]|uniref:UDP-N-acetylglucosamine 2-epimerase (Non-hydrolysing) n=1 Tax=Saccharothrix variisporea TaxID=543527 RepID=A0A495XJF5_9PSEU|nr:UDP-N-acetylglucosamine 2-epimerase [Saccharothrix variisporea]RKT74540.1 UDP-N-acetylglucosamine 2-epimerase (non-hydrolysing) [Saccharothrix variisporea]